MIIGVLRNKVFAINDFIELSNGIFEIILLIIGKSQLVKIGIVPFSFFTFIFFQKRNGFFVLIQIKIAFANDFIQF